MTQNAASTVLGHCEMMRNPPKPRITPSAKRVNQSRRLYCLVNVYSNLVFASADDVDLTDPDFVEWRGVGPEGWEPSR